MNARKCRPSWWQLWLLFPVLGILAFLDVRVSMPEIAHRIVEIGIVLIIFGLVSVWLRANEAAMLRQTRDHVVLYETGETLEPGAIAGGNGNGNGHKPEWVLPNELPESEAVHGDREDQN